MFELSNTLIKSIGIYLLVCYGLYKKNILECLTKMVKI